MMSGALVEKQVRLVLEQQCADVFMAELAPLCRQGFHCTLVMFDYGDGSAGNVAFKSSLEREVMLSTIEGLVAAWEAGGQRVIYAEDARGVRMMATQELGGLHIRLRQASPAGVGYALLVGRGKAVNYVSSADRAGVKELLAGLARDCRQDGGS